MEMSLLEYGLKAQWHIKEKTKLLREKNEKVLETAIKNSREINKGGLREIKGLQEYSK